MVAEKCSNVAEMLQKCCRNTISLQSNKSRMKIKAFFWSKKGFANLYFRLSDGRGVRFFHKSDIVVDISKWDSVKERLIIDSRKTKLCTPKELQERERTNNEITKRENIVRNVYLTHKGESMDNERFERLIDEVLHPEKYTRTGTSFFAAFDEYMEKHEKAETSRRNFMVLYRALQRFEAIQATEVQGFELTLDGLDEDILSDFDSFLRNEHTLFEEYPEVYERFRYNSDHRKNPKPQPRGDNAITNLMKKLRAFVAWCNDQEITTNYPFRKYKIKVEKYGRPVYISLEERNTIADYNLSHNPRLETQRDIFIFQCLIGCRVGDLLKLTRNNIVNGAVEYVAQKTKDEKAEFVRVPLNGRASAILKKYRKHKGTGLLPFITSQRYNDAIKEVFTACGITRMVTVINPTTGEEEKRPINEVASSHMARRTFVGNIYKQVKDPNLIGALSGHKEGSRAFARYRDIDEDIKKEVVSLIN